MRALVVAAALLLGGASLPSAPRAAPADGCGLPASGPLWVDYAAHDAPITPKPGLVLAVSSGTATPTAMRQAGAATIFFDLHLNARVGTTSAPADPATIAAKAKSLFAFAQEVTGCATPLIAENELFGAQTVTPWSATNAQYRANVLAFLQDLDALGATTALTIANPPYTGGDAADWWRQAAKASILVRQVYFTSPNPRGLYAEGPVRASRSMRQGLRGLLAHLTQIGIPTSRLALELQFQSAPGQGGRQGLQPRAAWLEVVKLEALAAKQVAAETRIEGVWSWGWPTFSAAGADPDKPAAVCVYLWARDQSLCDGPGMAGVGFDASLTEGQIVLPRAARCVVGARTIGKADVYRASQLTGDDGSAAGALLERALLRAQAPIPTTNVLAAERAIVRDRFAGSVTRYRAALAAAHVTLADGRAILADRLGRERVEQRFRPPAPSSGQIADFVATYATRSVRLVSVEPRAPWLYDAFRGFAVESIAPEQLFASGVATGVPVTLDTIDGRYTVRPLGPALPLFALPPARARDVARKVLGQFAKDGVYESWLAGQEQQALATAVCDRDRLPSPGEVDLTDWVSFLGA